MFVGSKVIKYNRIKMNKTPILPNDHHCGTTFEIIINKPDIYGSYFKNYNYAHTMFPDLPCNLVKNIHWKYDHRIFNLKPSPFVIRIIFFKPYSFFKSAVVSMLFKYDIKCIRLRMTFACALHCLSNKASISRLCLRTGLIVECRDVNKFKGQCF